VSEGQPEIKTWVSLGWMAYAFLGTLCCLGNLFVRLMGPCPAFSGNTGCHWSAGYTLWLFPLSQVAILAIGYLLPRLARKWARR
jgi:hypothetical protein